MADLSPRERRYQNTKQAILDAAQRIIADDGPDALSMRELAGRIDYSPAALYEYFGSKEEIVEAVCAEGHLQLKQAVQRADSDLPPSEYVHALGLAYIDFALNNPETYLLMFTHPPSQVSVAEMMQEGSSFPILLAAVERAVDEGVFQARTGFGVMEMAYAAWATVHGIAMLRITYLQEMPMDFSVADSEALRTFNLGLQSK